MVPIKVNLAAKANYGAVRNIDKIKYIVVHYTGNDGDTDENNGKYFHNNVVKASAHYFVDSDSITQSVPDNYVAWSVGGKKLNNGGKLHGIVTNTNSISVELCDDDKNGTIYPSGKTILNAVELVKSLMYKYNIPADNVVRHYDVTGKACPAYWCGDSTKDALWFTDFKSKLTDVNTSEKKISTTTNPYEEPKITVQFGSTGGSAKWVQFALNQHGAELKVDGIFGKASTAALKAFQKIMDL